MTVWSSKYALTRGVVALEEAQEVIAEDGTKYAKQGWHFQRMGKDAHATLAEANAAAERKRVAKIKSLRATIGRLEGLVFVSCDQPQTGGGKER